VSTVAIARLDRRPRGAATAQADTDAARDIGSFADSNALSQSARSSRIALALASNESAIWPDSLRPVHRRDVGACEFPIGGSSSSVAVATRQFR
jgi:hypothetical protein